MYNFVSFLNIVDFIVISSIISDICEMGLKKANNNLTCLHYVENVSLCHFWIQNLTVYQSILNWNWMWKLEFKYGILNRKTPHAIPIYTGYYLPLINGQSEVVYTERNGVMECCVHVLLVNYVTFLTRQCNFCTFISTCYYSSHTGWCSTSVHCQSGGTQWCSEYAIKEWSWHQPGWQCMEI